MSAWLCRLGLHAWSQWVHVVEEWTPLGLLYPKDVRGKVFGHLVQKRTCRRCGYEQREGLA